MARKKSTSRDRLRYLVSKLEHDEESVRDETLAHLAWLGRKAKPIILVILQSLNDPSPRVRSSAQQCVFAVFPEVSLPPSLRKALNSSQQNVRLAAIRELATVLPEIRDAIAARRPGWLGIRMTGMEEQTMSPAEERPAARHLADGQPLDAGDALTRGYLIRIRTRKERVRAMGVLGVVPFPYQSCAEDEFVVMGAHIKALEEGNVNFEDITERSVSNG